MQTPQPKVSFKEQMHQAREDAILQSTCQLLGEKAFDAMTMDDVANAVGIAKASLYKHFCSKEELCSAAMVQILGRVQAYLADLPAEEPLSLYVHIPYCREICWYCGCNTGAATREARLSAYVDRLHDARIQPGGNARLCRGGAEGVFRWC